jgi:methylated-DNA-[protein]-cysteine S-methyltransferase
MNTIYDQFDSPLGELLAVAEDRGLTGLYMAQGHRSTPAIAPGWRRDADALGDVRNQLDAYFAGELRAFELELAPRGTEFQRRVWDALGEIPYGSTTTYGALAEEIGAPGSGRAVGTANGRNPISIVIPCHRVVPVAGGLGGYAGGLERKRALLALERRD